MYVLGVAAIALLAVKGYSMLNGATGGKLPSLVV